jgi:hypothetical protein
MASSLKAQFEAEAAKQQEAAKSKEPTGVQALLKKHNNFIEPPPPKVSWKSDAEKGTTSTTEASHIRYVREGGKPKGPPPKKSLSDLP